jgi:hypothetical protein
MEDASVQAREKPVDGRKRFGAIGEEGQSAWLCRSRHDHLVAGCGTTQSGFTCNRVHYAAALRKRAFPTRRLHGRTVRLVAAVLENVADDRTVSTDMTITAAAIRR